MTRLLIASVAVAVLLALGACSDGEDAGEDPENLGYPGFLTNVPETIPFHEYTGRCHAERSCVEAALDMIEDACEDDRYCVSASIMESENNLCDDSAICLMALMTYDYANLCGDAGQECFDLQVQEFCQGDESCLEDLRTAARWLLGD